MSKCQNEISLTEVVTAIGILAALAALIAPTLFAVREHDQMADDQKACQSNLQQVGLALLEYSQDYDELLPESLVALKPAKKPLISLQLKADPSTNIGWAGKLWPYIKSSKTFVCPSDSSAGNPPPSGIACLSYALNSNMAGKTLADFSSPSKTIAAFEISNDEANLNDTDEGRFDGAVDLSAAGDGVDGQLRSAALPMQIAVAQIPYYATGTLDNRLPAGSLPASQFASSTGRHSSGSNFLAIDGHVKWCLPDGISAGGNALKPGNIQTPTGCTSPIGATSSIPCAEGTAVDSHIFTYSVK